MSTASRPGIPATAELARGAGPENIERWLTTLPRSGYARTHTEALRSALVINNWGQPTAVSTSGSLELSVRPHRYASPRERRARGLGTGAAPGSRPDARHAARPLRPGSSHVPPRAEPRYEDPFERQGGLLSIATQEPNWSRSPSLHGPILVSGRYQRRVRYAHGRVSADVER